MIKPFLKYLLQEKRYSTHTVSAYETDLLQFQDYLECIDNEWALEEANHKMLRAWVVSLIEADINPRSVNRKIASLRSFYKFLLKREVIAQNPATKIRPLKTAKSLPEFVLKDEMDTLLDRIEFPDGFEGSRDKLIIELLYGTGMRLSELIHLKTSDVDYFNQSIKVLGKRNKERIIPLTLDNIRLIEAYVELKEPVGVSEDWLLTTDKGKKCYPMMVYRIVQKYLGYISKVYKKSPHVLRHTYATHLLNNGADLNAVKDLLGHSSLAATQVYTHNSLDKLKSVFDQAHPKA
ncbi:tyrosine-type recombinase/integrase [Reichenbachiella carrageenanivorans]|uniref:Tyrosine recombinase XerC n=1 Tax=Reichenbachiella carrageenanivorans TaxID=2979869 RepID=A0ABY6D3S5_9BACT|nr:tyrosine-type recombinase/integrase [Reichenbachiella carrageenanivorans]UXX80807.1 tyrosine-type recombinase/integrase [Reichenbachiella carrageenanivorans]